MAGVLSLTEGQSELKYSIHLWAQSPAKLQSECQSFPTAQYIQQSTVVNTVVSVNPVGNHQSFDVCVSPSSLQPGPSPLWLPGGLCPGVQTVGSVHHRPRVWGTLLRLVRHEQWRGLDSVPETARWVSGLLLRVGGVWRWVWKCEGRALVGTEED